MKKIFVVFVLVLLCAGLYAEEKLVINDLIQTNGVDSAGNSIDIAVKIIQLPANGTLKGFLEFQEERCGDIGYKNLVYSIMVKVNGKIICLPKTALIDLYDVIEAKLKVLKKREFQLTIRGGAHGTGYMATLKFNNKSILERTWEHNECGLLERIQFYEGCE